MLEELNALKEKLGDNQELSPLISGLENRFKAISEMKENAVGESKKYKSVKHSMAEILGLDKELPIDELINNAKNILTEKNQKIESFQKNASSKEIEAASVKEQLSSMQKMVQELTEKYNQKETEVKISTLKDGFRKALNANRITNPEAQELVIEGYLNKASGLDENGLSALAKSIADSKPFLTQSLHKGGSGSVPYNNDIKKTSLSNIPLKDTEKRQEAIRSRLVDKGII
jgi:hypothetical protein